MRNLIRCGNSAEKGQMEENFQEAINFVNTCVGGTKIPSHIQAILHDEKCLNLTQEVTNIDFYVK